VCGEVEGLILSRRMCLLKDQALAGSDSVKNKPSVFADKGGDGSHLWDCKVFSCKSEGGATCHEPESPRLTSWR
jgi:hypothetical protein